MKRWWFAASPVILAAVVALLLRRGEAPAFKATVNSADRSVSATPSASDAPIVLSNENEMSDRDDPAKVRRAIEAGNVPINFWGRVVDQDDMPLPGVRIAYRYSVHHGNDQGVAWIEHETRKGEVVSDNGGSFAITNIKGHDLTIESLSKLGHVYRKKHNLSYNFGGNMPETRFESRPDKPVRFVMTNERIWEELNHKRGYIKLNGDGTPGPWNLWDGEADPSGELVVTFRREPAVLNLPDRLSTWSADLHVVGGEIMEAAWGEDVHRAPEAGYSATVPYPKEDQKEGVGVRSFYLRTRNGNYGRIQVELYPGDNGPTARCFVTSDMNPRPGSRNLESMERD